MSRIIQAGFLVFALTLSHSAAAAVESWYTFWGLGFADTSYPGDLNSTMDEAENHSSVDRTKFSADLLGFYWPFKNGKTMAGFVVNSASDTLEDSSNSVSINQYLYSISTMHFFGKEVGSGFFLRGDAGISKGVVESESLSCSYYSCYNVTESVESDNGFGYLAGIGYGFAISNETRVLMSLNYSYRDIEDEDYDGVALTLGGLW